MDQSRRVVITGMGTMCPVGNDPNSLWEAVSSGRSGEIPGFESDGYPVTIAGEVKNFDAGEIFGRYRAKHLDR